jgi:RNA-binding protein
MRLSHSQKKFLRDLGHKLKPVIMIGDAGVSEALLREFEATISHHELVKVRIRAADRLERDRMIEQLCQHAAAVLVSRVGNTALVYRPNADNRRIHLPA